MDNQIVSLDHKYRLNKMDLFILYVVVFTFPISYFIYASELVSMIYWLNQIFVIAYGVLVISARREFEMIDFLIILYIVFEFLSSIVNHENVTELVKNTKTLVLFYISFRCILRTKTVTYLKVSSVYLLILTLINTALAIHYYPKGMFYYDAFSPSFIMGADNTSTRLYIMTIVLCYLYEYYGNEVWHAKFCTRLSIINFSVFVVLRDIGNGKMCLIIFCLSYLVFKVLRIKMVNKPMRKIIIGNYLLFLVMVVWNKLEAFTYIIVNILKRDMTMSSRTTIWRITLEKIADKPLLGNGYMNGSKFESMLPSIIGINAHNTILMIMFVGGIVLSVLWVMILFSSVRKYDKYVSCSQMWFLPACFLIMFLRSQIEGGDANYLIAIVTIIESISRYSLSKEYMKICNRDVCVC